MHMLCPSCGNENSDSFGYCTTCGAMIEKKSDVCISSAVDEGDCPKEYHHRATEMIESIRSSIKPKNHRTSKNNGVQNRIIAGGDVNIPEGINSRIVAAGNVNIIAGSPEKYRLMVYLGSSKDDHLAATMNLSEYSIIFRSEDRGVLACSCDRSCILMNQGILSRRISRKPTYILRVDNSVYITTENNSSEYVTYNEMPLESGIVVKLPLLSSVCIGGLMKVRIVEFDN